MSFGSKRRAVISVDGLSLILEAVVGAHALPVFDRVAWEFAFEFNAVACRLRWGKRGLRLSLWLPEADEARAAALGGEVEDRLITAVTTLHRRAIAPMIRRELDANRVTVLNQYSRYRGMVDYFVRVLGEARTAGPEEPDIAGEGENPELAAVIHPFRQILSGAEHAMELGYLATALVAGYFAYIQHVLVLLSAFSPRALEPDFSVQKLLDAPWAVQFDATFLPPHRGSASRAKSELGQLAARYRNPLLHGGGGRPADGMYVEWAPGRSAMVTDDGELTDQFMLWQPAISAEQIDDILVRVGRIDEAFQDHPYFNWVRAGLEARFHPVAVRRALDAFDRGEVGTYTAAAEYAFERAVNWD